MVDDEGKFRESIWSIHPKWRGWFYSVLSFFGVAVFVLTLLRKEWSKKILEIFDAVWNGIVGSVVVVWFVFQVTESVMGAYQYFQDLKEQKLREICKEAEEKAEEYQKRYDEYLIREFGLTEDQIRQAHQHTSV